MILPRHASCISLAAWDMCYETKREWWCSRRSTQRLWRPRPESCWFVVCYCYINVSQYSLQTCPLLRRMWARCVLDPSIQFRSLRFLFHARILILLPLSSGRKPRPSSLGNSASTWSELTAVKWVDQPWSNYRFMYLYM